MLKKINVMSLCVRVCARVCVILGSKVKQKMNQSYLPILGSAATWMLSTILSHRSLDEAAWKDKTNSTHDK